MRRAVAALLAALLLVPALAWAQPELRSGAKGSKPAANPTTTVVDATTNALDVNAVTTSPGGAPCKTVTINAQGVAGADVTVDATVGGVTVMAASTTRCSALLHNTGTAGMRCSPSTQTPTTTVGKLIDAGGVLKLGLESQQPWKCIRTTASSTTANVAEATQ